ncbi:uncharacterized protein LOC126249581 isoform X2 [Schistocerca nitens]|uniref:uncharacterized protein LOC126249581 isoform X2 n=1 Tax=Schistocerca nitens TaxID=7011 RepID=UPI002117EAFD|nr:uncharacterized protein LOC126249581 isoform X2 [Schistocerca nitens]
MYTVSPVCNSRRTSHDGGSTEGAATIGAAHEHRSCTGEEQAGLWPADVRQSVPSFQLAPSLPPQRGPLPIVRRAIYTVSPVCNSSRTLHHGGSTEGAATIDSTHEHGSCTGDEQAELRSAGVRQPVPPSQLARSVPPQLRRLPIPRKAMYMVSSVCNSSTEGATAIGSTHEHGSSTGEEQAGPWVAGFRQPVPPFQLAPSWPPQLGPLPIPQKAMYKLSSVCKSSSTSHDGGSTEGAATISSTHEHGSSTGDEQAELRPAGVSQPVHPSQLACSLPPQLGRLPIPRKAMYVVSSVCNSSTEGATAIGSTHEHGSSTGFPQHRTMGGIMLTTREAPCPMPASRIHMIPSSKPSFENKQKRKRGEFPEHEAMRGITLTSREAACPMTASSINMKPISKPSTEYMTKLKRGDILVLRPYNERKAAAVQDVPAVEGQYRKGTMKEVSGLYQIQSPVQFPRHEAMRGIMLTSREGTCPMTATSIKTKPTSKPSTEYMTKLNRGDILALRPYNERQAAAVQDVPVVGGHYRKAMTREVSASFQTQSPAQFPQHEAMGGIILTNRQAACPMTTSSINMKPRSRPSVEYMTKQERGEFPQHETIRRFMLTSREAACPMTTSSLNMKPPSKPSMEYKTKQKRGKFSEQRIMGVSASAMAETVSASTFNDTMPGRASTEYTEKQTEGEFSEQRIMGVSASAMAETVSASTFNDTMPGRAPTEYTEKQTDGEFSEQRIMGVSASAMAETVSASTFNDTMPGRAPTEYTEKQTDGEFSEQRIMGVSASAMAETVSASTFNDTMPGRAPTEYTEKQTDGEDKHAETSSAQQPSPLPPLSILRRSEEELLQWPLPTPQDVEYYIGLPLYASSSSSLGVATAIHTDADTSEESPTGRG